MSFRGTRVVHHQCDPCVSEPIPMRKPPAGEPCAGEPHARFGGRGRREPFPTPIRKGCMVRLRIILIAIIGLSSSFVSASFAAAEPTKLLIAHGAISNNVEPLW